MNKFSFKINRKYKIYFIFFILIPFILMDLFLFSYFNKIVTQNEYNKYNILMNSVIENSFNVQIDQTENIFNKLSEFEGDEFISLINQLPDITNIFTPWIKRISYINADEIVNIESEEKLLKSLYYKINHQDIYSKKIDWQEPTFSLDDSQPIISGFMPIFDDEKIFKGFFKIDLSVNYFMNRLKQISLNKELRLFIINGNYIPIRLNRQTNEPIDYSEYVNWRKIIQRDDDLAVIKIDNNSFYTLVSNVEILNINLVGLLPVDVITKQTLPQILISVIITLIITTIILFVFYIISNNIIKNIVNINSHINGIKNGDFTPIWYIKSDDEFFTINTFINDMGTTISKKIDDYKLLTQKKQELADLRTTILHLIGHNSASSITVLLNNSQMLMLNNPSDTIYERMFLSSKSLKNLIDNLMLYLKIEEGLEVSEQNVSLEEVTKHIISRYKYSRINKKLTIISNLEDDCYVKGGKLLIESLLENLISNAYKYSKIEGTLYINCFKKNRKVIWSIKDSGAGFSEDDKTKMYNIFTTLSAKPTYGEASSGLGLYIIKSIIDHLKGNIELISESTGSTFILTFNY